MKKILIYADSPYLETGFAQVAKQIIQGLLATEEYQVAVAAVGFMLPLAYDKAELERMAIYQDATIYPVSEGAKDPFGIRATSVLINKADFDILFTLNDINVIENLLPAIRSAKKQKNFTWVTYTPIDTEFGFEKYFETLSWADVPVLYTNWAREVVSRYKPGLARRSQIIYHGTDTNTFKKLDIPKSELAQKYFGKSGKIDFLVTNVNRNKIQKQLPRTMDVFNEFCELLTPDQAQNVRLYLNASENDVGGSLMLQSVGLKHADKIIFTQNPRWTRSELNEIYNASDVIVTTTCGEGWGLSTTESMAAGTPIVAPDNSVFPELIGADERGYLIENSDYVTFAGIDNARRPLVDVKQMAQRLYQLYLLKQDNAVSDVELVTKNARSFVEEHSWDKKIQEWINLFGKVQ